jgi:putative FmdB family regulatory protein
MPIYEYECRQCGHRFEYLVLSSTPEAACPECQNKELTQQISLCAFSSEASKEANLNAAHRKAGAAYDEKQRSEHKHLHDHFDH